MFITLCLPIHVWNGLLILGILLYTLMYPSIIKYTCLEIKNMFLAVPYTRMSSYISATLPYPFIKSGRLLHIRWSTFTIFMGGITHMVFYQSIVATPISGEFCSRCYFGWEIPCNFCIWS